MAELTAIFNEARDEHNGDKDQIILALVQKGGITVTQAVREYQKLAKDAGIILGAKERTEKVNEMLADEDLADAEVRKELIQKIQEDFDVSAATAGAHIRKYAEDTGIELPSQQRHSLEDMVKFVEELHSAGKSRSDIVDALQEEMGYTANSAASAYSRATRELGISTGRVGATVPLEETVAFLRANQSMSRKALAEKMSEELGYAESTAGSFITYINMAKQWAAQELAERGIE
jgi:transposase